MENENPMFESLYLILESVERVDKLNQLMHKYNDVDSFIVAVIKDLKAFVLED